jgi:hypothetical protein
MITNLLIGNEKALNGGLAAGIVSLLGQVGVSGQVTVKEAAYSLATWVVAHIVIWLTTNTKKTPQPIVVAPSSPPLTAPLPEGKPVDIVPPSFSKV